MPSERRGHRGAVLIVVLGILVVLALMATTFAGLTRVDRAVARNHLDLVRAKLLAQAGVEDGAARIRGIFPQAAVSSDDLSRAYLYYGSQPDETLAPVPNTPLEEALNPSFAEEVDQNPALAPATPNTLQVGGVPRGYSGGFQGGYYGALTEHYVLRVRDLTGMIYVNDGVDAGPDSSTSRNLARILNVLGRVTSTRADLGDEVVRLRPAGGYTSKQQLLSAVGNDPSEFAKFRDFVTVYAWVDTNVCNPVPLSPATQSAYLPEIVRERNGVSRFLKQKDAYNNTWTLNYRWLGMGPGELGATSLATATGDLDCRVYGLDTLNPQWIQIVSRAPVNVNSAPREVLIALLSDLKGWFLTDRRRDNPRWSGDYYLSFRKDTTYSALGQGKDGCEVGYICSTLPIVGPGQTVTSGLQLSAETLAEEFLACREMRVSNNAPRFDYGAANAPWFKGPFRNWRQFNAFCDHMVKVGIINDQRPILVDFSAAGTDPSGWTDTLVPSTVQQRLASQACADLLKANFNPNLHLNELNPDANLYTHVDKTDLIVHSTEFTFLPSGTFEIEALGRVVRPMDPAVQDASVGDNELMAQSKIVATVKLYDPLRQTSQQQFYEGELSAREGMYPTNNNCALEVGPEPDQGQISGDGSYEWDGYLRLATYGGPFSGASERKPRNTIWKTLQDVKSGGRGDLGSALCVHFSNDFDAHHHDLDEDARAELCRSSAGPGESYENYPDPDESLNGPYDPAVQPNGNKASFRLARSYRTSPGAARHAPSDLREDGGYIERNAAAVYPVSYKGRYLKGRGSHEMTASFWLKPSFHPEATGKVRAIWDFSRYHYPCPSSTNVSPFALWFFASHNPGGEGNQPKYWHNNMGQFHPASFVFGSKSWHEPWSYDSRFQSWPNNNTSFGNITASLNHGGHADSGMRPDALRAHRWMHVSFGWRTSDGTGIAPPPDPDPDPDPKEPDPLDKDPDPKKLPPKGGGDEKVMMMAGGEGAGGGSSSAPAEPSYLMINGRVFSRAVNTDPRAFDFTTMTGWGAGGTRTHWDHSSNSEADHGTNGDLNHMRLGAPSQISTHARMENGPSPYRGNHTSDATYDEFFVWDQYGVSGQRQWEFGRYYKPVDLGGGYADGATFRSAEIELSQASDRRLAGSLTTTAGAPGTAKRILGASWTWYGEDTYHCRFNYAGGSVDADKEWHGRGILWNYIDHDGKGDPLLPQIELQIETPAGPSEWLKDDAFAPATSTGVVLAPGEKMRTKVRFRIDDNGHGHPMNWVLLGTPVLDDITVYVSGGSAEFLDYAFEGGL